MKYFLSSKTLQFNVLMFLITGLSYLATQPLFDKYAGVLLIIVGLGNIALRIFYTEQPITFNSTKATDQTPGI